MKLITVEAALASADLDAAIGPSTDQANTVRAWWAAANDALHRTDTADGTAVVQQRDATEAFAA